MAIESYKDLVVWQRAVELVVAVYELTEQFPKQEIYGLTSQIRPAAVSIPSNIAEGRHRGTRKDFVNFLRIAYGSAAELETQLTIAQQLSKTKILSYTRTSELLEEVLKMLRSMIYKLKS